MNMMGRLVAPIRLRPDRRGGGRGNGSAELNGSLSPFRAVFPCSPSSINLCSPERSPGLDGRARDTTRHRRPKGFEAHPHELRRHAEAAIWRGRSSSTRDPLHGQPSRPRRAVNLAADELCASCPRSTTRCCSSRTTSMSHPHRRPRPGARSPSRALQATLTSPRIHAS